MTVIADLPFDPNVIIVLVAVIFAGIKAFLERNQSSGDLDKEVGPPDEIDEKRDREHYEKYEAELKRQRRELEMPTPVVVNRTAKPVKDEGAPPPLPGAVPSVTPTRPKLSTAEKKALENLEKRSRQKPVRKQGPPRTTRDRVIRHLSSPTAAREALVLADILGPPKALKK